MNKSLSSWIVARFFAPGMLQASNVNMHKLWSWRLNLRRSHKEIAIFLHIKSHLLIISGVISALSPTVNDSIVKLENLPRCEQSAFETRLFVSNFLRFLRLISSKNTLLTSLRGTSRGGSDKRPFVLISVQLISVVLLNFGFIIATHFLRSFWRLWVVHVSEFEVLLAIKCFFVLAT